MPRVYFDYYRLIGRGVTNPIAIYVICIILNFPSVDIIISTSWIFKYITGIVEGKCLFFIGSYKMIQWFVDSISDLWWNIDKQLN